MRPSGRHCIYASFALLAFSFCPPQTLADTLTITSSPAGATVEIDGVAAGSTPYKTQFPGGYFHKTHTVFSSRLDHSMTVRISKEGYLTRQVTLTDGPFEWVAVTGRHHGSYFLLKSAHFDVKLDPISYEAGTKDPLGIDGPLPPASSVAFQEGRGEAGADAGSVTISSNPPGADIYVDGKFVGQTPSTIHLPSGLHRIEVKSRGKQAWERNLDVMKDSQLTLHPTLEESP